MEELYTPDQREIADSVSKLSENEIPQYLSDQHYGTVPRKLFDSFAALGLTGMRTSESYGGTKMDAVSTALALDRISRVDAGPAIFLSVHLMVCGLIEKFGSEEQKQKYLPKLASGEFLGAFALTEPGAGSDAAALKTHAEPCEGGYKISGEKCYITSAGFADLYIVFAKTSPDKGAKGISAFLVEKAVGGLSIDSPEKKMGAHLSPIASMHFDGCRVAEVARIGELDEGYRVALGGLAGGRINIAACANGIATNALQLAFEHLRERSQFNKKLIDFQGLQFMLADMQMKLEAAKLLVWQAARLLDTDEHHINNRIYPSFAKCFATDAAMEVCTDAVQLLGGAGYISEYRVEALMRDAKMLQIVEGTNQIQRMVISRELTRREKLVS